MPTTATGQTGEQAALAIQQLRPALRLAEINFGWLMKQDLEPYRDEPVISTKRPAGTCDPAPTARAVTPASTCRPRSTTLPGARFRVAAQGPGRCEWRQPMPALDSGRLNRPLR